MLPTEMRNQWSTHCDLQCVSSTAGEGSEFMGEALIREESVEAESMGDRSPDAGSWGQTDEEEQSPTTDQQTQETEVRSATVC